MDEQSLPPPLPKKKGGTASTNADFEFVKVLRDPTNSRSSFNSSRRVSNPGDFQGPPRRSYEWDPNFPRPNESMYSSRNIPLDPHFVDEDEVTNFLIEENIRRHQRNFDPGLKNSGGAILPNRNPDKRVTSPPIKTQRNPTLGEIVRGEVKNSSKRSLQNFSSQKRGSTNYSSERQILPPPSTFSDVNGKRYKGSMSNVNPGLSFNQPASDDIIINLTRSQSHKPLNDFSNHQSQVRAQNAETSKLRHQINLNRENSWIETLGKNDVSKTVQDVIRSIENDNNPGCKRHRHSSKGNKDESPQGNSSSKPQTTIENGLSRKYFFKKGIPDHPERDSLDGNLPGSSHTTSTGNPPPPPTPPNAGTTNNNGGSSSANNNNNVNSNPEGPDSPANFSKGPNSKSKKHKRLKNDTGTLDFPREKDAKKRPSYDSVKNRDIESGGYRSKTEPYTYLWVVMSRMYGKMIVLLMFAFCLTEVLDNKIAPLTFQEVFLLYLYVGSIIAIMCIYVTVIIDNCPSITASKENLTKPGDPEVGSITSFGTLKRAHISRSKTSRTSFYLRVGALVFGLGTLIYNGLEIAMHSSIAEGCVSDTILAHPILQALFTFLQMHFLFVNSEVIVEKFGQVARFGFMHLVATNLAIWVRMVVWESANDSMVASDEKDIYGNPFGPRALGFHSLELQRLSRCYQNNTLGQLWSNSQQYLFPFLVQYSLIAASVTYIMWCNVGKERLHKLGSFAKSFSGMSSNMDKRNKGHWKVDCRSASKGLFLGLLVLVGGIVILIIFFVMKDEVDFKSNLFWMCNGTMIVILGLCIIATIFGFVQIPKLSISTSQPMDLDRLLLSTTVIGVYIFSIFGMIVGGIDYNNSEKLATFCTNVLLLIQVSLQGMLVAEASRRTCTNRFQMIAKPGRQVITFLLFSNITLWILDTFMTHNSITHQFQIEFYGKVVWGVISRISLPLIILFRFHSAVILVEIWKNTYRTKAE